MKDKEKDSLLKEIPVKSSIKKRDDIWDNYKGILSFTVVFAHYLLDYLDTKVGTVITFLFVFINIFHMPVFIFCSGFFSKSENSKSKDHFLNYFYII